MPERYSTRQVTLHCGDCMDVLRNIKTNSVDAVIVDPPYGMDYQSSRRAVPFARILNDKHPFIWFIHDAFRVCKDAGALLCFCIGRTQETFRGAIATAGFKVRSQVVWDRMVHGQGDCLRSFAPQHDVMWFATKNGFRFPGGRPKSVLRHRKVASGALQHPTEKPVELMAELIEYIVPPGGRVLDPCMGSGSTGVAAVRCGRRFTGIEQDVRHYRVAKTRIQEAIQARVSR